MGNRIGLISVAAADLDGDGDLDLATGNVGAVPTISILANDGQGILRESLGVRVGDGPMSVATVDFDGDGMPDLASAQAGERTVSIRLNQTVAPFSKDRNSDGIPDECQ